MSLVEKRLYKIQGHRYLKILRLKLKGMVK